MNKPFIINHISNLTLGNSKDYMIQGNSNRIFKANSNINNINNIIMLR